jgi:hypothetical protein
MSPDDPTLVVTSIESRGSGQRIVCVRAKNQFGEDFRLTIPVQPQDDLNRHLQEAKIKIHAFVKELEEAIEGMGFE